MNKLLLLVFILVGCSATTVKQDTYYVSNEYVECAAFFTIGAVLAEESGHQEYYNALKQMGTDSLVNATEEGYTLDEVESMYLYEVKRMNDSLKTGDYISNVGALSKRLSVKCVELSKDPGVAI